MTIAKKINFVTQLKKAGYKLVDSEEGKMETYESSDQRVVLHKIHGTWYIFSECLTPVMDEFGMPHHERCGLSFGDLAKFYGRLCDLKEAAKNNA